MGDRLLSSVYLFTFLIVIILIIMIVSFLKKKKHFIKNEMLIFIPLLVFIYFYLFNYNFFLLIRSNVLPEKKCTVEYNFNSNLTDVTIDLPPKSVFLFKTPTKVYYSKCTENQCINFFHESLTLMKSKTKIKDFNFDNSQNKYNIILNNNKHFEIFIIKNEKTRYGISRIADEK